MTKNHKEAIKYSLKEYAELLNQQSQKIEELIAKDHDFCFNYTKNYNDIKGNTLHLIDKHTKIDMDSNKIHITITPPNFEPLEFIYYITGVTFAQSIYEQKKEEY